MTGMEESASGQRSLKSQGVEWVARWGTGVQDPKGNQVVRFTYEGQNGSILMDAPPGTLNPQELSDEETQRAAAELREIMHDLLEGRCRPYAQGCDGRGRKTADRSHRGPWATSPKTSVRGEDDAAWRDRAEA